MQKPTPATGDIVQINRLAFNVTATRIHQGRLQVQVESRGRDWGTADRRWVFAEYATVLRTAHQVRMDEERRWESIQRDVKRLVRRIESLSGL
jgi:hypothetical protein